MKRSEVQVLLGPRMIASARIYGDLAQLVEHLLCKQGVRGSTPLVSTKEMPPSGEAFSVCVDYGASHSLSLARLTS